MSVSTALFCPSLAFHLFLCLYLPSSCLAPELPGHSHSALKSVASRSLLQLSTFLITQSKGEQLPYGENLHNNSFRFWKKTWPGSLKTSLCSVLTKTRARRKELNVKLQQNIAASLPPWLNPTLSSRDGSTHRWTRTFLLWTFVGLQK